MGSFPRPFVGRSSPSLTDGAAHLTRRALVDPSLGPRCPILPPGLYQGTEQTQYDGKRRSSENAPAKRVNGILKTEWLDKRPLRDWSEAQAYVEQIIGLYNSLRPHQSLSYLTPDLVHRSGIATQRKWKNYRLKARGRRCSFHCLRGRKVKE